LQAAGTEKHARFVYRQAPSVNETMANYQQARLTDQYVSKYTLSFTALSTA